jgi:tRNA A-37 threonylcarbamoyl transferase component Bud32
MTDDGFETRVLRFEQAWRLHGPLVLADYLGGLSPPAGPERYRLLIELICVDLECRWQNPGAAGRATLDHYVAEFPELGSLDRLPLELIGEEYRVQCRWGARPVHAEFLSRFRERRDQIGAELLRVDGEIDEESAEPPHALRSAARTSPRETRVEVDPGMHLLSHRDFLLRRLVGAGRMGKVYEARQHGTGREVAVKFLRNTLLHHPEVVRRFIGEARTIARLHHPNIVGTQGLGRTPGGSYFIVMDLVPGPDLARVGGRRVIAVDEAIRWAIETCDALGHAHERGIVHCDLKPANLLLDEGGRIRVTDFGLARSLAGETPRAAEVEGTAPFMAPEQISPCWGSIDQRTDVYGIGAVLFAMVTGRPPFVGRRVPDVLAAVASAAPVVSPRSLRHGVPEWLDALCRKCLAKEPAARFPNVHHLRSALAEMNLARS